jgi:hypothetical protein
VLRFASGFFPTRPRGASTARLTTGHAACSCLRLTVATNSPRKALPPPIQCPWSTLRRRLTKNALLRVRANHWEAFKEATLASARLIERDGRRIGYVHVWPWVIESPDTLAAALINFRSPRNSYGQPVAVGKSTASSSTRPKGAVVTMRRSMTFETFGPGLPRRPPDFLLFGVAVGSNSDCRGWCARANRNRGCGERAMSSRGVEGQAS